jgi:hypothetical protein
VKFSTNNNFRRAAPWLIPAAMLPAPASANLLSNGSFETPSLAATPLGYAFYADGSTAIPSWTVGLLAGAVNANAQLTNNNAFAGLNASDGVQYLDLTGNVGRGAGVVATVATVSTLDYVVAFDVGAFFFGGSFGPATVALLINGGLAGSYAVAPPASNAINWQRFSYQFAGSGSQVSIGLFSSLSPSSSSLGVGLDNVALVSVAQPSSAVPEPASWAMLIAGLGLVGALARRRRLDSARSTA